VQLPASLPSLQGLQHFACTSGWERLRSLAHLQELSLHSCALDAVAPLGPLPSCTALDLSCNQIVRWRHRGQVTWRRSPRSCRRCSSIAAS
jgi:hypothetical protein